MVVRAVARPSAKHLEIEKGYNNRDTMSKQPGFKMEIVENVCGSGSGGGGGGRCHRQY